MTALAHPASDTDVLAVAATPDGCCVRVSGRGTARESAAARDVATRTLAADPASVVVFDLTHCGYLDSPFLGCLTGLFRGYGRTTPPRFFVAGPAATRKKLLGPCRLDALFPTADAPPPVTGEFVPVPSAEAGDPHAMARHMMACHRALASVDSPMRPAFARIADQLEQELAAAAGGARRH